MKASGGAFVAVLALLVAACAAAPRAPVHAPPASADPDAAEPGDDDEDEVDAPEARGAETAALYVLSFRWSVATPIPRANEASFRFPSLASRMARI